MNIVYLCELPKRKCFGYTSLSILTLNQVHVMLLSVNSNLNDKEDVSCVGL